jgi:hypothetical protein
MVSVHLDETSVECLLVRGVVQFYKYLSDFGGQRCCKHQDFYSLVFPWVFQRMCFIQTEGIVIMNGK